MWQSVAKGTLGWLAAQKLANNLMGWTLNRDEAYVDRIKREFKLREYHQARELYEENPSYWERLYGSDPLTSQNRPASLPSSLVPRPPPAPGTELRAFRSNADGRAIHPGRSAAADDLCPARLHRCGHAMDCSRLK